MSAMEVSKMSCCVVTLVTMVTVVTFSDGPGSAGPAQVDI